MPDNDDSTRNTTWGHTRAETRRGVRLDQEHGGGTRARTPDAGDGSTRSTASGDTRATTPDHDYGSTRNTASGDTRATTPDHDYGSTRNTASGGTGGAGTKNPVVSPRGGGAPSVSPSRVAPGSAATTAMSSPTATRRRARTGPVPS
jgi:hypothetical protein